MLGIDAGGSKTVALLARLDGQVVAEGRAGGANLRTHGELLVEKTLHEVIDQVLNGRADRPVAVCLGIAGVDRDDDAATIRGVMRRLGFREHTVIVNDALIALVAGAQGTGGPRDRCRHRVNCLRRERGRTGRALRWLGAGAGRRGVRLLDWPPRPGGGDAPCRWAWATNRAHTDGARPVERDAARTSS